MPMPFSPWSDSESLLCAYVPWRGCCGTHLSTSCPQNEGGALSTKAYYMASYTARSIERTKKTSGYILGTPYVARVGSFGACQ